MEETIVETKGAKSSILGIGGFRCLITVLLVLAIVAFVFNIISVRKAERYGFLDSTTAELEVENFLEKQHSYRFYYAPLKEELVEITDENPNVEIGIYFEDLNTRAWVGINEKKTFIPASLLKVSTAAAILKMVEEGEFSLEREFEIGEDDVNERFGILYDRQGESFSVEELIEIGLKESDNTAIEILKDQVPAERLVEARLAMGLPISSVTTAQNGTPLAPRDYSNIFKSLYISSYLSRESSNYLLSVMSETNHSYGLRQGVPRGVVVSNKIGVYGSEGSVHDCGIVYEEENHYLLCVMTRDQASVEESEKIIEEISKTVYDFMHN